MAEKVVVLFRYGVNKVLRKFVDQHVHELIRGDLISRNPSQMGPHKLLHLLEYSWPVFMGSESISKLNTRQFRVASTKVWRIQTCNRVSR